MKLKDLLQYIIVLIVLGVLGVLLMDRVVMPLYVRQGQVRYLPNVVGLPFEEAVQILRKEGFRAVKSSVAHTQEYPPDQIFEMYPEAYARVKKGRIILLTVTDEEEMAPVPHLIGKTLRSAEIDIARAGLAIDTTNSQYSDDYPANVVMWQYPRGGNLLRRGSGIVLMISLGKAPPSFYVPSVVGMSFQAGRREIIDAGLPVGQVTYLFAPRFMPNTIITQSIEGGTVLKFKRAISIRISTLDMNLDGTSP